MSSNLTTFTAFRVFRVEGIGVSIDASSSGAGVAEMNGSVPAIKVEWVSKQHVRRPNELTHAFEVHSLHSLHGLRGLPGLPR